MKSEVEMCNVDVELVDMAHVIRTLRNIADECDPDDDSTMFVLVDVVTGLAMDDTEAEQALGPTWYSWAKDLDLL